MKFSRQERDLTLIVLVTTVWTFAFAYITYTLLSNKFPDSIISIWNVWDTQHYLEIAEFGYTSSTVDERNLQIVFFPLYPYVIKVFSLVFKNYLLSSLLVSNLAYAALVFYLFKLVTLDRESEDAFRSVIYISVFPTAIFLHAGYTESLFLALTIASFYYARREKWAFAGILGMLAAATRVSGIILFPVLIVEYMHQSGFKIREIRKNILWLAVIALGFVFYLAVNYATFGDPLKFLEIQNQHWHKRLDWPYKGFLYAVGSIFWREPGSAVMVGVAEPAFAVGSLLLIIYSFFRIRLSYCLYALATFLIVTSTSFWLSIPRYMLSIFPIFIALALLGSRRALNYTIIFISITLYTFLLIQYVRFVWAF